MVQPVEQSNERCGFRYPNGKVCGERADHIYHREPSPLWSFTVHTFEPAAQQDSERVGGDVPAGSTCSEVSADGVGASLPESSVPVDTDIGGLLDELEKAVYDAEFARFKGTGIREAESVVDTARRAIEEHEARLRQDTMLLIGENAKLREQLSAVQQKSEQQAHLILALSGENDRIAFALEANEDEDAFDAAMRQMAALRRATATKKGE